MKLKQPVNWKHTTFLWILRFMLSGVAVSIVFQCLKIIELFSSRFYAVLTPCLQLQMPAYMLFCFCGAYRQ